jgi:phospholipid transport system substrate-binding protein
MKRINRLWCTALLIFITVLPQAAYADSPSLEHLKISLDSAQQVLRDPKLASARQLVQRRKLMRVVLQQLFDFDEMSRRSLGANARKHRERMGEFTPLFVDFLEHNYMGILEANGDAKIQYVREIKNDDYVQINTKTRVKDGSEYRVDYRMHTNSAGWRVYDVSVEGISLVNNYRSQFDRILNRNTFDDLLRELREKRDKFN